MDEGAIRDALEVVAKPGPPRLLPLRPGDLGGAGGSLGLVPGSYDPMTVAHAELAEALRDQGAGVTLLVYSPRTLPKEGPAASEPALLRPERRVLAMLAFAAARAGIGVALCSHGLYVDQAEAAAAAVPGAALVFAVGSDKVLQLVAPGWYEDLDAALNRLFTRATVEYAVRAGDEERLADALSGLDRWRDRIRPITLARAVPEISSSAVRRAWREGRDIGPLVPSEVRPYLER